MKPRENNTTSTTLSSADCHRERGCLLCGSTGQCAKCVHFITADQRRCVLECPRGYIEQWSNNDDLQGIVCQPNGYSDPMLATVVMVTVAVAGVCLLLCVAVALLARRRHRQKGAARSVLQLIDETAEREDFLKQLDELRPNAEYFLAMLNDTRRQIRKLFLAGDQAGANAYRTIIRDLAKVLLLLNRPVELIAQPPHDWPRVYAWARRILDRCRPQISQLIEFLQHAPGGARGAYAAAGIHGAVTAAAAAAAADGAGDLMIGSSQYSTFKSTNTASTMAATMQQSDQQQQQQQHGHHLGQQQQAASSSGASSDSPDDDAAEAKHSMRLQQQQPYSIHLFGSLISLHELHDDANGSTGAGSSELHPTNPFRSAAGGTLKRHTGGGGSGGVHSACPPSDVHGSSMWLEDEFFKLGFRPQDEITTEL